LGSLVFTLICLELGARLFGFGAVVEFQDANGCGYLMKPSQTVYTRGFPVSVNSLGLRGPPLREPKSKETVRVVFLGDSICYGGGRVRESELFCRVIEAKAHGDGLDIEAVSVSAPGWSPQNIYGYLSQRGLHQADFVVLVLPECDLARPFHLLDDVFLFENSPPLRLMTLAEVELHKFKRTKKVERSVQLENAHDNVAAIEKIRRLCVSVPFVVAFVPSRSTGSRTLWPLFESELPDAVDLRGQLSDPSCYFDDWHLTAKGHQIVGNELYSRLLDRLRDLGPSQAVN
jgi:hypothetical protein